jgi:hypothetical protein
LIRRCGIPGCATAHFNKITELDGYGNVDALFVIGRTLPKPQDTRRMALALFGADIPLENPTEYPIGVLMEDGSGLGIVGRLHTNPYLESIRQACADAEVIQAVGRGRGVNRTEDRPLRVYLLTDSVVPFPVQSVEAWRDVEPTCLDRMWLAGGVAFNASDAAALYPDLFGSANAAKKAIQGAARSGTASPDQTHKGRILYRYLIEDSPPVNGADLIYQVAGARQKLRRATVPAERIEEFRSRLEAIHGPLPRFEVQRRKPAPLPQWVVDLTEPGWNPVLVPPPEPVVPDENPDDYED